MASTWIRATAVLLLLGVNFVSCNVFDHILEDIQPCKDACDKTYPLHSYPTVKHSECCKRGCRFFSLVELINDGQNINATKDACMASCMEAYSQTGDRYACNIGCSSQMPFALQKQHKIGKNASGPQTMHLLTPFMYVHNIYNNMVDKMSRIMSVSWSFYLQQDDGKVVVLQSEPEIITEYLDMDEVDYDKSKDDSGNSVDEDAKEDEDEAGNHLQLERLVPELHGGHLLPDVYHYGHSQDASPVLSIPLSAGASNPYGPSSTGGDDLAPVDWLGCVARKSGLPRWLIGLTILMSSLAMVWLCFSTTVTAPDHHIHPQKVSIYGDLEYLRTWDPQEKVRIQPNHEEEAPALPVKILIQQV